LIYLFIRERYSTSRGAAGRGRSSSLLSKEPDAGLKPRIPEL